MEIKKEETLQIASSNSETKLQDIDISEDLLEIKPEGQLLVKSFKRLDKELKLRLENNSLEGNIWVSKANKYEEKKIITTKILSANIIGKDIYQREKTLR